MSQDRRKAIVTGAASGIGAATMVELARRGFDVACLDINAAGGEATVRAATAEGGQHHSFEVDVADEPALVRVFAAAVGQLGGLDALATAAGVGEMTPFMELDAATFRRVYDVNVIGTFLCLREAAKVMPRGARICTAASVAGIRGGGLTGTAAYAASKGGVLALTKNAARALAERGIDVNTIAPGATLTPMIAEPWKNEVHRKRVEAMALQGRTGAPDEIARAIAFLLSADASFVSGATLVADGGLAMY